MSSYFQKLEFKLSLNVCLLLAFSSFPHFVDFLTSIYVWKCACMSF